MRLIRTRNAVSVLALIVVLGVGASPAAAEATVAHAATTANSTVPSLQSGTTESTKKKAAARQGAQATKKPTYSSQTSAARQARLTRARAATRAREQSRLKALQALQVAMTPRYKTDASGALVPDVRAAAAIIFNPDNGKVLWEENAQDKRSIASITKVMTTVVFLEDNPDLTREITVERSDVFAASTTYLKANDRITLDNVLHLTLIASDNAAARALARAVARRHRRLRRADEREGARARAREHVVRRSHRASTRTTSPRPTTSRASSPLRPPTSGSPRSCGRPSIRFRRHAARSPSTAPTASCAAATSRSWAARPASSASPATAWPRCCACPRATTSCRRGPRRDVEQRPFLGNPPPVRLAVEQGRGRVREGRSAVDRSTPSREAKSPAAGAFYLYPFCIAAASSGNVAT